MKPNYFLNWQKKSTLKKTSTIKIRLKINTSYSQAYSWMSLFYNDLHGMPLSKKLFSSKLTSEFYRTAEFFKIVHNTPAKLYETKFNVFQNCLFGGKSTAHIITKLIHLYI